MPLLAGSITVRRYRVVGDFAEATRDALLDRLAKEAFRDPLSPARGGENAGWVKLTNLADTAFDFDSVFHNQYMTFALRVDNKRLPGKLLKALLDLRMQQWMREKNRERVPTPVKKELREQLELELFPKQLPSVAVHDVVWNLSDQVVWFMSGSNKANELFRALFAKSFAAETRPFGPLQILAADPRADRWARELDRVGMADLRPREAT
jgi:DNA recombination-dependent growth factor C